MNDKFIEYLKKINVSESVKERVCKVLKFYEKACSEEIEDIFICDRVDLEKGRTFESLWLFSRSFGMEAKNFLSSSDDFDSVRIKENITYWNMKADKYDYNKSTEKSRMQVSFKARNQIDGSLLASSDNCDYLNTIFRNYIVANIS